MPFALYFYAVLLQIAVATAVRASVIFRISQLYMLTSDMLSDLGS
jgi:hypothetical protein